jgi:hypothetical protein
MYLINEYYQDKYMLMSVGVTLAAWEGGAVRHTAKYLAFDRLWCAQTHHNGAHGARWCVLDAALRRIGLARLLLAPWNDVYGAGAISA